jgi:hypothetical protein
MPDLSPRHLDEKIKEIYSVILALSGIVISLHQEAMAVHNNDEGQYTKRKDEIGSNLSILLDSINKLANLLDHQ